MSNKSKYDYDYCQIGGLVCLVCKFPIRKRKNETYVKAIGNHEIKSIKHNTTTSESKRKVIEQEFYAYINGISSMILSKLSNENLAKKFVFDNLDTEKQYFFCSECNMLVIDRDNHKMRQHGTYCTQQQPGRMSKYWTSKNPSILRSDFSFENVNDSVLCV
jgi:hypothetical protein